MQQCGQERAHLASPGKNVDHFGPNLYKMHYRSIGVILINIDLQSLWHCSNPMAIYPPRADGDV